MCVCACASSSHLFGAHANTSTVITKSNDLELFTPFIDGLPPEPSPAQINYSSELIQIDVRTLEMTRK